MALRGIYFNGRGIVQPGAYAKINAASMVPNRPGAQNTVGVIGEASGGEPRTVLSFTSPVEARSVLRGGTLLDLIELMFSAGPDSAGPQRVEAYRVDNNSAAAPAVQAVATLDAKLTITARDYGDWTNLLSVAVAPGTAAGKKILIRNQDTNQIETGDDLGPAFTIQYTGTGSACTMDIAGAVGAATTLTTTATAGLPTDDLSIDLTQFPTLQTLVDHINGQTVYTCTADGDALLPTTGLDLVAAQDVKTAPYAAQAALESIIHWMDQESQFVTATRIGVMVDAPLDQDYQALTGGTNGGVPAVADWQTAIDAFSTVHINFLLPGSSDAAVHQMALSHVETMSSVTERKPRMLFCGGAAGETPAQAISRGQALASKIAVLAYPGVQRRNLMTGSLDTLSPVYHAALLCGLAAGMPPEEPITWKTLRVEGMEKDLTLSESNDLLRHGISHSRYFQDRGVHRVVAGLTTWISDDNVIYSKIQGARIGQYLDQEMRDAVDGFVGSVGDRSTVTSILNAVVTRLRKLTRSAQNQSGVLTEGADAAGNTIPAFDDVTAVFDGIDLVSITFLCHPVGEVDYITVTANLEPTKIVAR